MAGRVHGRRSKLTPDIHAAIVKAVSQGLAPSRAGVLLGLDDSTVNQWIERGENRRPGYIPHPRYIAFAKDIRAAWVSDEQRRILRIERAAEGGAILSEKTVTLPNGTEITEVKRAAPQWAADAWWLERTRRDEYALRTRTDVTHDLSPALLALQAQWQQAREQVAPPRALPEPDDAIEAEVTPLEDVKPPGQSSREHTYHLLDKLNGTNGQGG